MFRWDSLAFSNVLFAVGQPRNKSLHLQQGFYEKCLEIQIIYLKIILGKQLVYKLRNGYLNRKTHCWQYPESTKDGSLPCQDTAPDRDPWWYQAFLWSSLGILQTEQPHYSICLCVHKPADNTQSKKEESHVNSFLNIAEIKWTDLWMTPIYNIKY